MSLPKLSKGFERYLSWPDLAHLRKWFEQINEGFSACSRQWFASWTIFCRLCLECQWIQVKVDGMLGLGDFWNQWFHLMMASFTNKSSCFKMGILRFFLWWWWILLLGLPADVRRWVVVNIGFWVRISTARGTSGSQRRKFRRIEKKYSQIRFNHGHCHCSIIILMLFPSL